jgi:hypothetical protein
MNATTMHEPTSSEASRYRTILDRKISEGAKRAASVIETIHQNAPTDAIVPTSRVRFSFQASPQSAVGNGLLVGWDGLETFRTSDHALAQVAERAGAPTAYIRQLASGIAEHENPFWSRALAADILNTSYANLPRERVLARRVGGQLRGWLSDRYRRLDSRPLVDALAQASQELGAIPVDGSATETRVALKVMMPEIIEPVPGEYLVLGLEWSNSDYGNGTHGVREFVLRVACLNGMTRENLLRQIHLGGRLGDSIEYSDRTLRLDTAASVSALRDTVRGALGPAARSKLADRIRAASDQEASSAMVRGALKGFPKETAKLAADAFDSEDVLNLPAGKTAWRASNAISWIAKNCEDAERRLDLERAAGSVVS